MKKTLNLIIIITLHCLTAFCQHVDTIYYDAKWKKITEKDRASYFRLASKVNDSLYSVKDCYLNGNVQMTGFVNDLNDDSNKTNYGYFVYYDSAGYKLNEGNYLSGKRVGEWLSYYRHSKSIFIRTVYDTSSDEQRIIGYDSLGRKKTEGTFNRLHQRIGEWKYYYSESGFLKSSENFRQDRLNGVTKSYWENKMPKFEGLYIDNKASGLWKYYFKTTGLLAGTKTFIQDTLNGPAENYDSVTQKIVSKGNNLAGKKTGVWEYYSRKTGNKKSEGGYVFGDREGIWKYYYDCYPPKIKKLESFKKDTINGFFVWYDSLSGKKITEGEFEKAKKVKTWKYYYETGRLKTTENFNAGKLDGEYVTYDSLLGNKIREGKYAKGKKTGTWTYYYPANGKVQSIRNYTNGLLNGTFVEYDSIFGGKIKGGWYDSGEKDGKWKYFHAQTGKIIGFENYKSDKLDGDQIIYDSMGNEQLIAKYTNDEKNGNWKLYYPATRQVWIDYNFKEDSLDGELITYYSSGKTKRQEKYDMGKILSSKCYNESAVEIDYYPVFTKAGFQPDIQTYIGDNLQYPEEAKDAKIEGKVLVRFVVNENGNITDVEVLKGIGYGCDEEAVRLVSQMPPWIPARLDGKPYKTYQTLPIVFWIH